MSGVGPVLACVAYAALLWGVALALDAVGRRSLRPRDPRSQHQVEIGSDVARFHRVIGGAALAVGAFLLVAYALARRDGAVLLLVPVAGACFAGAVRRVAPLWRDP